MANDQNDGKTNDEHDLASQQVGISDAVIQDVEEALESGYEEGIVNVIADLSPADAAELLVKVSEEDRETLIEKHAAAFDPESFSELPYELRKQTLETMSSSDVAAILSELESDDALDIVEDLEEDFQKEVIRQLSARMRLTLEQGLNFPEESAGRLMQREFVAIPQFWTVGKTIDFLRAAGADDLPDEFFDLFVITPSYHIVGVVPLDHLVRAQRTTKLETLVEDESHSIPATMDQEQVAQIFRRENLTSAPVVDDENRLIGVITIDDVVDVIDEEAQEDILKLAGVGEDDLYSAVLSTTNARFRWLFLNLLTAILAAGVISLFDASIEKIVALAVLMPIVASMGGNAGTQALAVAVRALAMREVSKSNMWRMISKEVMVGTLNGAMFAIVMGVIAAFWFNNGTLGLVIGAAMIINLIAAGLSGAAIPLLLHRFGSDPAVSSVVFLTTVTDVVGFMSFLGLATIFLM